MFTRRRRDPATAHPSGKQPPVRLKSHHAIGRKELSSPSGIAIFASGASLAVGDERNNRVVCLDLQTGVPKITVTGTKAHTLTHPRGVAVDDGASATYSAT